MKEKIHFIKEHIVNFYKKEKKIIAASILSGLVITVAAGVYTRNYSYKMAEGIAGQVIRFHVLANSDEAFDQNLKIKIKDKVLEEYSGELNASSSIEETRQLLSANMEGIKSLAQSMVYEEGYDYPVSVSLAEDSFPTKEYGDITLPAGRYEALRIEIGEAQGKNWWCVMFPPLCFVDVTKNEVDPETKEMLQTMLTEEEYKLLDNNIRNEDEAVKIKFKIVEWWQERDEGSQEEEIIIVKTDEAKALEGSF